MKALIMAGGEGTRLRPLTCDIPKPMVDFLGKPLMQYTIELLKQCGITEIAVTLLYMGEKIRGYFGDGASQGLSLRYYTEREPLGTAGCVRQAADFLKERFLLLSGDALTDLDIQKALESHERSGAPVTIILKKVENPLEYGVALLNGENRITQFFEKPAWTEVFSNCVNTGCYILEPEILSCIPENRPYDFAKEFFPMLLKRGVPINGHITESYWCDIGSPSAYLRALQDALFGKVRLQPMAQQKNGLYLGENVRIGPSAILQGPCYIGSGSLIENGARVGSGSVIGANCHIEKGVHIKNSVVGEGCRLSFGAKLSHALLCGQNAVGQGAKVLENAVIGKGSRIGGGACILAQSRIWPEKWIENGSVIRKNITFGFGSRASFFGEKGFSGEIGSELEPADILRAGALFAQYAKSCLLGCDAEGLSAYLSSLFMEGFLGAGKKVFTAGVCLPPLLAAKKEALGADYALYGRFQHGVFTLSADLPPKLARSLSADFRNGLLPPVLSLGEKSRAEALAESYHRSLPKGRLPILVSPAEGSAAELLLPYLHKAEKPLFTAHIGKSAEKGYFSSGRHVLSGDLLLSAAYETALRLFGKKTLRVHRDTPNAVLGLIRQRGGDFSAEAAPSEADRMLRDFPYFALLLGQRLLKDGLNLPDYLALLPKSRVVRAEIGCAWRDIGHILASLAEEMGQCSQQGFRLQREDASLLVSSGENRPSIRLLCEAASFEAAQDLAQEFSDKIKKLLTERP